MSSGDLLQDKVASYLSTMTPDARNMLLRRYEGEGGANRAGGAAPERDAASLLGRPLRTKATETKPARPRIPVDPRRIFFGVFDVVTIDEGLSEKQPGWVERASIDAIWTFLGREAMPEAFVTLSGVESLPSEEAVKAFEQSVTALRRVAFSEVRRIVAEARLDPKDLQKLTARLGGPRVLADLEDMFGLADHLPRIEAFVTKLPATVEVAEVSERMLIDQIATYLDRNRGDQQLLAAVLALRPTMPVSMPRVAHALAGSGHVAEVRKAGGASFVDLALSAGERCVLRFEATAAARGKVTTLLAELRAFFEIARSLTQTFKLDDDKRWWNRLSTQRAQISEVITRSVNDIIPTIRRALRSDLRNGPSEADIEDAVRSVTLLAAARRYREQLAVNELVNRVAGQIEQSLEIQGRSLMDELRKAQLPKPEALVVASSGLVRMSEAYFGEEHAGVLRKARAKALQSPS